jgi:hypothetical protein
MTEGMTSGCGNARDQFGRGKGLLLRNATGDQCGINPNAKSSYDLDADRPIYPWQPLEKKGGEGKVSRDFVYGAMTLMLAAGLVAALTFLQGAFSL